MFSTQNIIKDWITIGLSLMDQNGMSLEDKYELFEIFDLTSQAGKYYQDKKEISEDKKKANEEKEKESNKQKNNASKTKKG